MNKKLDQLIDALKSNLPETCLEICQKQQQREDAKTDKIEVWSTDWENQSTHKFYLQSDEVVLERLQEYVLSKSNLKSDSQKNPLIILDVGAGKGRLATSVIKLLEEQGINYQYLFLEPSTTQCEIAEANFRANFKDALDSGKIVLINKTLESFAESHDYASYTSKLDCIISSGGPLNLKIVTANEAKQNLERLKPLLKADGTLLATGFTHLHFTKRNFKKNGLNTLNAVKRSATFPPHLFHFYVAKPAQNPQTIADEVKMPTVKRQRKE